MLLTCILDAMDDICYVSDPETYELIYVNRAGRQYLPKGQEIIGRKCYHALQQLDKPCDFCTNHLLSPGLKYNWERFNAYVDDHFALTDTLIEVDGKLLRLEVARNITEYKNFQKNLEHRLNLEETLSACVRCLASGQNVSDNINNLLAVIGEYYGANRAYIFEIYYDRETLDNTYEWCRPGVSVQIDNLKNLPIEAIDVWLKRFRGQGYFSITALNDLSPDSLDYQILEPQGVKSLMAAPLVHNDKIVGFLGVDDPARHTDELRLLQMVPVFLQDELMKRRMIEKMEWLSFRDALTGLYNRNKYASTLNELMENPPCKMGIIYVDINGLKIANDSHGHEYGDRMIARVANHIESSVRGDVYRIGGDEFVVLCPAVEEQELEAMVGALRKRMAMEDISVSIGTSWNDDMVDVTDLIRFADHRMYAEKQNYYKSQLGGQKIRMEDAARKLMDEIERGEFVVKFQPQVDLQTGCIAGAEALVRKIDANSVLATPDKFIPIYEMEGVVRHLDFYLLERACAAVKDLAEVNIKIPIMTTFSPYTLQQPGVVNDMLHIC
ncbi:MAG: diguanylate cyclase, partial [Desulfovibrionaceae bacterium]|nr:diguanylate cyclase [Desulfovibrionaceae bacterium]